MGYEKLMEQIEKFRQDILNSTSEAPHIASLKEEARLTGGLPIIRDMGRTWALKADLSVVLLYTDCWESENKSELGEIVEDNVMRCFVVAYAAIDYPELVSLVLERPANTSDCMCSRKDDLKIFGETCKICNGLGWIPSQWLSK